MSAQLFKALAAAQADLKPPKFDSSSTAFGGRPYRYASLAAVVDAARAAMAKHGLSILQPATTQDGRLRVETIIAHASGETWSAGAFSVPQLAKMQDVGGQLTYLRRYSLCAALAIAAEEDNDCAGQEAAERRQEASEPARRLPAPSTTERALQGKAVVSQTHVAVVQSVDEKTSKAGKPYWKVACEFGNGTEWFTSFKPVPAACVGRRMTLVMGTTAKGDQIINDIYEAVDPEEVPF